MAYASQGWVKDLLKKVLKKCKDEGLNNYSTEEIVIGKWIDGKPLYRKVKYVELSSASNSVSIDMAISDIDLVINSFGYLINNYNNENQTIPTGFRTADNSLFFTTTFSVAKNSFTYIRADKNHWISNVSKKSMVIAIVEYTKTTD